MCKIIIIKKISNFEKKLKPNQGYLINVSVSVYLQTDTYRIPFLVFIKKKIKGKIIFIAVFFLIKSLKILDLIFKNTILKYLIIKASIIVVIIVVR